MTKKIKIKTYIVLRYIKMLHLIEIAANFESIILLENA